MTHLFRALFLILKDWLTNDVPPEELDMQTLARERWLPLQFLTSLLHFRSGWFANHALQRTRHGVAVCNRCVSWAGSLSLGR